MTRLMMRAAVVGMIVLGTAVALPQAASAGGISKTCQSSSCSVASTGFPGGTLSVDADLHGTGWAQFYVTGARGYTCRGSFRAEDPPGSWLCHNVPSGAVTGASAGPEGPSNIGLRW